jgi:hypothetical protein
MANAAFGNLGYHPEDYRFGPEDTEAFREDEDLEALEASLDGEGDEAFENFEASDEGDEGDEGDEAFASVREDEAFLEANDEDVTEADPESDEAVSGFGYAVDRQRARDAQLRADARMRAAQSLNRSANVFASNVQRKLDMQLQRIPKPPTVQLERLSTLRGSGVFKAKLPNGRETAMMLTPTPARQADVNRLNQQININDARQAKAIRMQAVALARLKAAQSTANALHKGELLKFSKDLNKRITDGDTTLDKRIAKEVEMQRKLAYKRDMQSTRDMAQRQKRATWNTVLVASAVPLFAAYGDRAFGDNASLFTKKNAILTGSLLGWLYVDDVVAKALARSGKERSGLLNWWQYLAPVANAATVYLALRNEQHERFVTGITELTWNANNEFPVPLAPLIGSSHFKKFSAFTSVSVVASLQSVSGANLPTGVQASVKSGVLTLKLIGANLAGDSKGVVAWSVDTLDPKDQRSKAPAA